MILFHVCHTSYTIPPLGRSSAKQSILWVDNCPGQNKNNYMVQFFQDLIRRKVYSRIDYKFLIPGHTYMVLLIDFLPSMKSMRTELRMYIH